jgi:hypothetical protein
MTSRVMRSGSSSIYCSTVQSNKSKIRKLRRGSEQLRRQYDVPAAYLTIALSDRPSTPQSSINVGALKTVFLLILYRRE